MSVRISRPQADTLRAVKNGMNTVPPLKRDVVAALVRTGRLIEITKDGRTVYELTEEGRRFC